MTWTGLGLVSSDLHESVDVTRAGCSTLVYVQGLVVVDDSGHLAQVEVSVGQTLGVELSVVVINSHSVVIVVKAAESLV